MISIFLLIPIVVSFLICVFLLPFWIRKAHQINLIWDDMNKINSPKVAGSGGIFVILAFIAGLLLYIAYRTFYLGSEEYLTDILTIITVILLVGGLGFVDDLMGWKKGGLSRRSRLIFIVFASIPLIAINVGKAMVSLPIVGTVNLGIFYPLVVIPLGVVGAAATYNFLAGFNGLEAGQGILMLSALTVVSFLTGSAWLGIICLCMVAALLGFLIYNFYPAKVFPGNSLTLGVGSLVAIVAVLGNFERVALFIFIPVIIEVILKTRGKLIKQSFGKPTKEGSLELKYDKIYSLNHLAIYAMQKFNINPTERRVVYSIWGLQLIIILLAFVIFREGLLLQ